MTTPSSVSATEALLPEPNCLARSNSSCVPPTIRPTRHQALLVDFDSWTSTTTPELFNATFGLMPRPYCPLPRHATALPVTCPTLYRCLVVCTDCCTSTTDAPPLTATARVGPRRDP